MRWQWDHSLEGLSIGEACNCTKFLSTESRARLNVEIRIARKSKRNETNRIESFLGCTCIFLEWNFVTSLKQAVFRQNRNESFVLRRNRKDVFGFYRILRSRAMIAVLINVPPILVLLSFSKRELPFTRSMTAIIASIVYKTMWMENGRN